VTVPHEADEGAQPSSRRFWALRGARQAFGIPGLILFASMLGFGGLASESGIPFAITVMMTSVIWALPSQVVLVGAIAGGLSLMAATVAVALSAVRLLPMTVAIMPLLSADAPRKPMLLAASHFVAVTPWVAGLRLLGSMPPQGRVYWYLGLGFTLSFTNTIATALGYWGASTLPPMLAAGLVFLTPAYFLLSLILAATGRTDYYALVFGLVATPLATLWLPDLDLLIGGVGAGTLAYLAQRMTRKPT
jgi:predicted branched-subunit amino acid permease